MSQISQISQMSQISQIIQIMCNKNIHEQAFRGES